MWRKDRHSDRLQLQSAGSHMAAHKTIYISNNNLSLPSPHGLSNYFQPCAVINTINVLSQSVHLLQQLNVKSLSCRLLLTRWGPRWKGSSRRRHTFPSRRESLTSSSSPRALLPVSSSRICAWCQWTWRCEVMNREGFRLITSPMWSHPLQLSLSTVFQTCFFMVKVGVIISQLLWAPY